MTLPMFIGLLSTFSVLSSLIMEGVKKWITSLGREYASNFVVLVISLVVGIGGTAVFYVLSGIAFTSTNVICMILMGLAVWLVAMNGYDKVVQLIKQFESIGR